MNKYSESHVPMVILIQSTESVLNQFLRGCLLKALLVGFVFIRSIVFALTWCDVCGAAKVTTTLSMASVGFSGHADSRAYVRRPSRLAERSRPRRCYLITLRHVASCYYVITIQNEGHVTSG